MKLSDLPKAGESWQDRKTLEFVKIINCLFNKDELASKGYSGWIAFRRGRNDYHLGINGFLERFVKTEESKEMNEINENQKDYIGFIQSRHGREYIAKTAHKLEMVCHGIARQCGWWENTTERDVPRLLMLCVSELAEAMEGDRKGLKDDHLPDRDMLEVELADCLIRIFDMAGGLGLDVAGAMAEKLEYNTKRADHKPENREKPGGKTY